MLRKTLPRRLFWAGELLLLAASVGLAAWHSRPTEWHPALLVGLLLMIALVGQWLSVEIRGGHLSASLVAIVLAMSLLGPAPAVACGVAAMILRSATSRLAPAGWLNNLAIFAVVPFTGGLMVHALAKATGTLGNHDLQQSAGFGLIILGVFIVILALSFVLFAMDTAIKEGRSVARELREIVPLLPGELSAGALATMLAVGYASIGLPMLIASLAILLIFRQLTVALLRSEDRAEQLYARSRQLVGLQLGVLRTLLRALSMRDQTTARHAAAVARYAGALADELGCSEEEREIVHTAGLLHEIGKFTWPDRVLHADVVGEEDTEIVRNHPQEGAVLVGALDGYGPVADAILYHHERVDGQGYPAGLIGKEIPLASRILAVCSTYDTITARASYRDPMTPQEAMTELRSGARNGQLDGDIVETFIALLEHQGPSFAREADFEAELDFERRVRDMAQPQSAGSGASGRKNSQVRRDWRSGIASLKERALHKG